MRTMIGARLLTLMLTSMLVACAAQPSAPASPVPTAPAARPSGVAPSAASVTPTTHPTPGLTPASIHELIATDALAAHLEALQAIVDDGEDGHRATGSATFAATADHVEGELLSAGYVVERMTVNVDGGASVNLLVERAGTGAGVVVIGAHLDSVAAGPGINDNASGIAALLVIAEALRQLPAPTATIRLAFWGAEEGGPFGSRAYVNALPPDELAEIRAYLNLDMIGSPNAAFFVYDEAGAATGSAAITNVVSGFFVGHGFAWDPIDLGGDSDHGPFATAGVPTGGLFSGGIEPLTEAQATSYGGIAGEPADPCSHRSCDAIDNVDLATLAMMTDAAGYALAVLAGASD